MAPIQYYILCRDEDRVRQWRARTPDISGVDFRLWTGYQSMYQFVMDALRDAAAPTLIVAHDDVIVGRHFAPRTQALIKELNNTFPNWGLAGNAGAAADNISHHVFVKDPWCRSQRAHGPEVVACIDGNLMLINKSNFVGAKCEYPDLGGFHGYDLVLSFECIRAGLLVVADGRLAAVHLSGGNRGVYEEYIRSAEFQHYFRARFADRSIPSLLGAHPVAREGSSGSVPLQPSLQTLIDHALAQAIRTRPCRLAIVRLGDAGNTGGAGLGPPEIHARPDACRLMEVEVVDARDAIGGTDRHDLATTVLELVRHLTCDYDYLWFLTAAANTEPDGVSAVTRALASRPEALVVGGYLLEPSSAEGRPLPSSSAGLLAAVFAAERFPLSALVFPTAALRRAVEEPCLWPAFGDGALMAAIVLSAPGIRTTLLRERIVSLPNTEAIASEPSPAYGPQDDWDYVDRIAILDAVVRHSNPMVWALASRTALAHPPPSPVKWAQDIGHVMQAVRAVLHRPGKYLGRGLSLGLRYLVRGDIRGLTREARLFRPR